MKVRELGNRVFQIYIFTILTGTFFSSIGVGLYNLDILIFFAALFYGGVITAILSLPNILILNLGLRWIYKNCRNEQHRNQYFYYLWICLFLLPLFLFSYTFSGASLFLGIHSIFHITSLLPLPYIIAALYFIFKINNKYDKTYPINYNQDDLNDDILDANMD